MSSRRSPGPEGQGNRRHYVLSLIHIFTFKLSDWTAPLVEDYFGIPGVSLPTMSALSSIIIAALLNWLLDKICLLYTSRCV